MTTPLPREYAAEPFESGYRIRRVPIFAEHERTFKGADGRPMVVKVDRARLEKIARNYNSRVKEDGWRGPIHGAHNGKGATGPRLGYLDNYRVEQSRYNGKPTAVLFADYIIDGDDHMSADERLQEIKRYPYRSVEINLQKDEAASLALLDREAPYFKFPLFKVETTAYHCDASTEYGIGYALYGERYSVLTYSEGPPMKDGKDKDMGEKAQGDKPEDMKSFMSDCKKQFGAMMKKFEAEMGRISKVADYAEKAMIEDEDDEEEEVVEKSKSKSKGKRYKAKDKDEAEAEEEPAAVMNSDDADHYSMIAEERAKYRALEARVAEMEETENRRRVLQEAADAVAGYNVGDIESVLEDCLEFYEQGGEVAVKAYTQSLTKYGESVHDYADDEDDGGVPQDMPEEVAKYAGDTTLLKRADELYKEFHGLSREMRRGSSPAEHIANHIHTTA